MPTESSSSQSVKPLSVSYKTAACREAVGPGYKCAVKLTKTARTENLIERMPPEILIKIISYLDASSLFCIGHVNKLFLQLANNSSMWHKMYLSEYSGSKKGKAKPKDAAVKRLSCVEVQERPVGYWRRLYFRTKAGYNESMWKRDLRNINPYTGLPRQTERVLRNLRVTWEMSAFSKSGWEGTFEQSHAHYSELSVSVCWSSSSWPSLQHLSHLQLHGVTRVPLNCPNFMKPGWRSQMAQYDLGTLSKTGQVIDTDRLVDLLCLAPGVIMGMWKDRESVAFVMVCLHFNRLVERSLLSTSVSPQTALFDDVDPNYGLHGYTLHIVLHNTEATLMSDRFSQLSCQKDQIRNEHIHLSAISRVHRSQHRPLVNKPTLPWMCEALQGSVENCCVMSLTLLDEAHKPFWCVSTPVSLAPSNKKQVSYDYEGNHFLIQYQEAEGKVRMELVWLEEQGHFLLVSLLVSVALDKVNKHFGRHYSC
ncbi:F-box only protein 15 [Osmerus mordax]|uniref:F-box only protein 15 n=1 Tax=Osmerus mordax TaxID=8014 RepID=UPI003510B6C9